MKKKRVLILVNHDITIYNYRKELVEELIREEYEVYISTPIGENTEKIKKMGAKIIPISFDRHGKSIVKELKLLFLYIKLLKIAKPSVVLTYTIKPNIYGALACRLKKIPHIANITGLGNVFTRENILSKIVTILYKISLKKSKVVFVQNESILEFMKKNKISKSLCLIPGSGVNLEEFKILEYPIQKKQIEILYIGRILKSKGISELVQATKLLNNLDIMFTFIGFIDEQIPEEIFNEKNINYLGFKKDIKTFIGRCDAVILPSYHEGMANVLLEASACGRPVLGSNISGIKEIIDDGVTGFLFNKQDVADLIEKIELFYKLEYEERKKMGLAAREKIEKQFNRKIIVDIYLDTIKRG